MPSVVVDLFAAKALLLNVLAVELSHEHVIKFEPLLRLVEVKFLLFFYKAVVVAAVCGPTVDHNTNQLEVVVVLREA